ncbi:MAG TPA: D-alanyl-D-alanine carboxypeptidase/D-alanyl-D-alanine-endopeptidase, partial [Vicinamibacterales bacterium]|nr:D-alanyl-D-alanine carboxypeptidase/D-alanyl-D-alanine-endopeptidase [Vicinamibacterales bacterium]
SRVQGPGFGAPPLLLIVLLLGGCASAAPSSPSSPSSQPSQPSSTSAPIGATADKQPSAPGPIERRQALDAIFNDPLFARAMFGVRVESVADGRVLYTRNSEKLVVPASNMKLLTMSVAAEKLGWDFTFETRLEAAGTIADGTLNGDLIVVGGGDPSIDSQNFGASPLFDEWAEALRAAGIRRIQGRLIGDDNLFDETTLGPGWAWDYLGDGYAAGSSGLNYNENSAIIRIWPGPAEGAPARVELSPAGHGLTLVSKVTTSAAGTTASLSHFRNPGSDVLEVTGTTPIGRAVVVRTAAVENPTRFFVSAFKAALEGQGIAVRGGAWDIDALASPPVASARRTIATRHSLPLSALGAYFIKESQNFYGETILKTLGQRFGGAGSTVAGRRVVGETLTAWGIPADSYVMYDGSGLSRYNYVSADAIVSILKHVWNDERLRGPFLAALPIGGQDGTLELRMRNTVLAGHVQAKTGTISNVRSLSGFLITDSGERLVFSMIANHFTATSAQVDAVVEKALIYLATHGGPGL